jgi:hypothetical protein
MLSNHRGMDYGLSRDVEGNLLKGKAKNTKLQTEISKNVTEN